MIGVIVNTLCVLLGSFVGILMKKGIPEKISGAVMSAIGLCAIYIGIDGALEGNITIVLIVSMVIGTVIGSAIDIDRKINKVGNLIERKMKKSNGKTAEGFMTGSLLFCIGAMTVVGSLNSGLRGDHEIIFTKSVMDLISSCMLASTLGIGVMFSAIFVFTYQGLLVLLAGLLQNILTDYALVSELTCAGSIMIIGLGLNIIGVSKLKIANMLPSIIVVPIVYFLYGYLPI